jgi:uncharacterized membrane protein
MRCENCGVDMVAGAAFCPSCGKPAGPSLVSANSSVPVQSGTGLPSNVAGALCYLAGFITGIVFLVLEPYQGDRFVRFHAFQSISLNVAWVALYVAVGIASASLPGALRSVSLIVNSLLSLAVFLLWLFLMYKAYSNDRFKVPVIGDLAERQA